MYAVEQPSSSATDTSTTTGTATTTGTGTTTDTGTTTGTSTTTDASTAGSADTTPATTPAAGSPAPWTVVLPDGSGHDVTVASDGTDLTVTVDGVAQSQPLASVTGLTVDGGNGDDTVTLDAEVGDMNARAGVRHSEL